MTQLLRSNLVQNLIDLGKHLQITLDDSSKPHMVGQYRPNPSTDGCRKCGKCCRRFWAPAPKKHYLEFLHGKKGLPEDQVAENEVLHGMMIWIEPVEGEWPAWSVTCRHYDMGLNCCRNYGDRPGVCQVFNCRGSQPFGELGGYNKTEYLGCTLAGNQEVDPAKLRFIEEISEEEFAEVADIQVFDIHVVKLDIHPTIYTKAEYDGTPAYTARRHPDAPTYIWLAEETKLLKADPEDDLLLKTLACADLS